MILLILGFILSIICTFIVAHYFLPFLQKLKFGQPIYELGPESHQAKQGTLTMGGLMFAGVTSVLTLILSAVYSISVSTMVLIIFSILGMMIGFADDFTKIHKKHNLGLIWWQKIVAQTVIAFLFTLYCYANPTIGSAIIIPFFSVEWNLGIWYFPVMILLIMFIINSANLQDGLDGLLSSVSIVGNVAWSAILMFLLLTASSVRNADYFGILLFCLTLTGSLMAFLRYNFNPAKVFMGDTGSMFIGAAMVGVAMLLRQPLLLILIAFTMIMSSVSVILQRAYFKLTHGKRIFKMSPIHHHFEKSGMNEPQIVAMYSVTECALSILAVLSLLWI